MNITEEEVVGVVRRAGDPIKFAMIADQFGLYSRGAQGHHPNLHANLRKLDRILQKARKAGLLSYVKGKGSGWVVTR